MRAESRQRTIALFAICAVVIGLGTLWAINTPLSPSHRISLTAAYAPPIRQALYYLAERTPLPLAGPVRVPGNLSARVTVTKTRYMVQLYRCSTRTGKPITFPLNSPKIETSTDCSGLAQSLGTFAGQQFASVKQAQTQVLTSSLFGLNLRSHFISVHHWRIALGEGVTHDLPGLSLWEHTILHLLRRTTLPAQSGIMLIQTTADGNHTEMAWQHGTMVYSVWDNRSTRQAIRLVSDYYYVPNGSK